MLDLSPHREQEEDKEMAEFLRLKLLPLEMQTKVTEGIVQNPEHPEKVLVFSLIIHIIQSNTTVHHAAEIWCNCFIFARPPEVKDHPPATSRQALDYQIRSCDHQRLLWGCPVCCHVIIHESSISDTIL